MIVMAQFDAKSNSNKFTVWEYESEYADDSEYIIYINLASYNKII